MGLARCLVWHEKPRQIRVDAGRRLPGLMASRRNSARRSRSLNSRKESTMAHPIRFGIQTGQQGIEWKEMLDLWQKADAWGYDSLWNFDHFYPIFVDPEGPCFEGWTTLSALGAGDQAGPHRPPGERQHLPPPVHLGEDGGDARSHQRRPPQSRHRRRLVRARAPAASASTSRPSPAASRRSTRPARSCAACSRRRRRRCTASTTRSPMRCVLRSRCSSRIRRS